MRNVDTHDIRRSTRTFKNKGHHVQYHCSCGWRGKQVPEDENRKALAVARTHSNSARTLLYNMLRRV